ncbi:MAG: hypothetical protein ACXQTW_03845 [Candidatus Methanospirareceae archaeon]
MRDPILDSLNRFATLVNAVEKAGKAIEFAGKVLEEPELLDKVLPEAKSASPFPLPPLLPLPIPVTQLEDLEYESEDENPYKDSRTFKGQSDVDYCFECLVKHFSKALTLAEEAESFSISAGRVTQAAAEKIRKVINEITGAEDDLEVTQFKDPELKKLIDEIRALMRETRKYAWGKRCVYGQCSIDDIRELKQKLNKLVELAYKGGELYITKEQRNKILQALEQHGVEGPAALKATDIISKYAASLISKEEAEHKLAELLGWEKVELEIRPGEGVILKGRR